VGPAHPRSPRALSQPPPRTAAALLLRVGARRPQGAVEATQRRSATELRLAPLHLATVGQGEAGREGPAATRMDEARRRATIARFGGSRGRRAAHDRGADRGARRPSEQGGHPRAIPPPPLLTSMDCGRAGRGRGERAGGGRRPSLVGRRTRRRAPPPCPSSREERAGGARPPSLVGRRTTAAPLPR
jgi:hypothetical protein